MHPALAFIQYAQTFEQVVASDQWSLLDPMFSDDAVHTVDAGGPFATDDRGRAAVIAGLRRTVEAIDLRFDVRIPEIVDGPRCGGDRVWMRFRLRLRRAGLPELCVEGDHLTVHAADGRIAELRESLAPGHAQLAADYLAQHDAALRPVGSRFAPVARPDDLRDLQTALETTLARCQRMVEAGE